MDKTIFLTAVGDIAFTGRNADRPSQDVFGAVSSLFKCSRLVVANLENPLIEAGQAVPGKCVLRGNPAWAKVIREAGINIVSLANNHMMDYGREGLVCTMQALDRAGVFHVGAGFNQEEACAPLFVESDVGTIAFLARTAVEVSSPSYATVTEPGVAFLDEQETHRAIQQCREQAGVIVLMLHWGMEHYSYPAPEQRKLAGRFVDTGVDVILGHHPHVLQGIEKIVSSLIVYSVGNFLFDEFNWSIVNESGAHNFVCTLSEENRKGVVLQVTRQADGAFSWQAKPTQITPTATVKSENISIRQGELVRLSGRFSASYYDKFWKLYALKREWDLRLSQQLSLEKIVHKFYKIRPRHVLILLKSLRKTINITSGKSTNPYE